MKQLNRNIEVKSNESAKTFTIRTFIDGKLTSKFRTYPMSSDEFDDNKNNTMSDWNQFLKGSDYYLVK